MRCGLSFMVVSRLHSSPMSVIVARRPSQTSGNFCDSPFQYERLPVAHTSYDSFIDPAGGSGTDSMTLAIYTPASTQLRTTSRLTNASKSERLRNGSIKWSC
jgi:hypothetical protein